MTIQDDREYELFDQFYQDHEGRAETHEAEALLKIVSKALADYEGRR